MAVGPREGFIDTSGHSTRRLKTRARSYRASQVMRGDAAPLSQSSRSRSGDGNDTRVSFTTTMDDATTKTEEGQEDCPEPRKPAQDRNVPERGSTSRLVQQMQQLQLPLGPESFQNIRANGEFVSLPPPLFSQPQRPTQTLSHADETMLGYDGLIPLVSPGSGLPSASQWPSVPTPSSRLLMSFPRRSHQLPPLNNSNQASNQPLQPKIAQPLFNYESGMAGLELQAQLALTGKDDILMEEEDEDVLLDDASLDMLVSTLARETARIEAANISQPRAFQSRRTSDAGDGDEDEDEEQVDNQRYSKDHHEYSSEDSSHPSTPSASTSDASARRSNGKGKAKPKRVRRACIVPGCGKRSRSLGLCIAHGGGRRCIVEGCDKSSQGGNHCIKHGGGKRCSVDGCDKAAQTNSLCKAHGGGPRCQFEDCEKSSQGGGYCRQHGGGKRCAFAGCMKGTQRGSYCALHGGSRLCIMDGCRRNDRGGGYCAHHGGGKRCTIDMCTRPSRRNGLCSTHLRVLGKDEHSFDDLNESIDQGMRRNFASTPSPSPTPSQSPFQ